MSAIFRGWQTNRPPAANSQGLPRMNRQKTFIGEYYMGKPIVNFVITFEIRGRRSPSCHWPAFYPPVRLSWLGATGARASSSISTA